MKKSDSRIRTDNGRDDHNAEYHSPDSAGIACGLFITARPERVFRSNYKKKSVVQLLREFYHSTWCVTGQRCDGTDPCLGAGAL